MWEDVLSHRTVFIPLTEEEYGLAMRASNPDFQLLAEILCKPVVERTKEENN